ncbi:MAG TPA: hypothetical protein VF380_00535 [Solirubrobacteraceae bacterium]
MTPELRAWLERERAWGVLALRAIARRGGQLHEDGGGLERFGARMALVELTGSVAKWAHGLNDGLGRSGHAQQAAAFAIAPPFAATDPTAGDCERLGDYVEARLEIVRDVLAEEGR